MERAEEDGRLWRVVVTDILQKSPIRLIDVKYRGDDANSSFYWDIMSTKVGYSSNKNKSSKTRSRE